MSPASFVRPWCSFGGAALLALAISSLESACGSSGIDCSHGGAVSLSDYCSAFGCQTMEEAFAGYRCIPSDTAPSDALLHRVEGCGLVTAIFGGGYTGGTETFDATSGQLVGVSTFSDIQYGPCKAFSYHAGNVRSDSSTCPDEKHFVCLSPSIQDGGETDAGGRDAGDAH